MPTQRFDAAIESAAYRLIAQTVNADSADPVEIAAHTDHGVLVVEVEGAQAPRDLADLEDRVGALGGTLEHSKAHADHGKIRAEIPCAS
jgi:hypothetical protein